MQTLAAAVMVLAMAAAGCAPRRPVPPAPPPAEPVVDLRDASGEPVDLSAFVNAARTTPYILIGEQHDSACDHLAQAALLRALARDGLEPALGLEMAGADKQPVLDLFSVRAYTVPELEEKLDWPAAWGYGYDLYAPLFRVAREYAVPVFGLNVPHGMAREFGAKGAEGLTETQRAYLPPEIIPQPPEQEEELRAMFEMHEAMRSAGDDAKGDAGEESDEASGEGADEDPKETSEAEDAPREAMERFFRVQSLWDTAMARRTVDAARGRTGPVVVVAGGGHVEYGWGIAHRLRVLDPDAPAPLIVMPWRGPAADGPTPDADKGDLFFYCPATLRSGRLGMTLLQEPEGVRVTDVVKGSRAADAGVREGDLIIRVGGAGADSLSVLHVEAMKASRAGKDLELTVRRTSGERVLAIPVRSGSSPGSGSGADD